MIKEVTGKTVLINKQPMELYSAFSDLRTFSGMIPEDKKKDLTIEEDSVVTRVHGMEIGFKIFHRVPFSLIEMEHYGETPFPFLISMHLDPAEQDGTLFHIEMKAELSAMLNMMIGVKMQDIIDQLTQQIADASAGKMPDNFPDNISGFNF